MVQTADPGRIGTTISSGGSRVSVARPSPRDVRVAGTPGIPLAGLEPEGARSLRSATVIAHRGASGYRPEHTVAGYQLAIRHGADVIEPDLVSTRDGVLVARHENEISGTTDVAQHPEFADRRTTKLIDGREVTGWFTEDFTLAELRTLRAVERIPHLRPGNTAYDGLYQVPTFEEVVQLARRSRTRDGTPVGIAPETKHPSYFEGIGLPMEEELVRTLHRGGFVDRRQPVVLQSFETGNLRALRQLTDLTLVQLISSSGAPYDLQAAGDGRTYADLASDRGLAEISGYADAVGLCKHVMIPRNADGTLGRPTSVIRDAQRHGLQVIGWTFRRENHFLPTEFRRGDDPTRPGDMLAEIEVFLRAGMDAFFTDNPDLPHVGAHVGPDLPLGGLRRDHTPRGRAGKGRRRPAPDLVAAQAP